MTCLAALGVACVDQTTVTPTANSVVVHAVIDASVKDQIFVVQTTTGAQNQQRDVKGARVTITTPDLQTIVGQEFQDTAAVRLAGVAPAVSTHYRLSFGDVRAIVPGGRYLLHIVLPDGREVDGTTIVPNATPTSTVSTLPDFDRLRDTLSLAWPANNGAIVYEVFIQSSRSSFSIFADTSVVLPGRAENGNGSLAFWPGYPHRVVVSAVDANYYDYYRRSSDFFTGLGIISHLQGAVGVFGSIVPTAQYSVTVK